MLRLHDIEQTVVEADIKKYLTDALSSMSPPPSSHDVERLAKRAGRLFIYAATAIRYIRPSRSVVNSHARLRSVLKTTTGSSKQHEELDNMYTGILSAVFNGHLEREELRHIQLTLKTVVCARQAITVRTIASLLSLEEQTVWDSLEPLRSVLLVQEGVDGLVSPFHQSFLDYIHDNERSKQFYCDPTS